MGALTTVQIEKGMRAEEYFAVTALSNSGMKDLAVSPYRYWFRHLSPDRPIEEPTPAQRIGSALHCAVLEPTEFEHRYCCEIDMALYPDCLDTIDQMRAWLRDKGMTPKGTRKAEMIAQVQAVDPHWPVLEVLERAHAELHTGKDMFRPEDWDRVNCAADSLLNEPSVQRLLEKGEAEVSFFVTDPDTGVHLKARMDWVAPEQTVDLKTFTQMRGKSIDLSVSDALYYEGYLRQAEFYGHVRKLESGKAVPMVFPFVESDAPHEVRIKKVIPGTGDLHSAIPRAEMRGLINLYAECMKRFGNSPWRERQTIERLQDGEIKALAFS